MIATQQGFASIDPGGTMWEPSRAMESDKPEAAGRALTNYHYALAIFGD